MSLGPTKPPEQSDHAKVADRFLRSIVSDFHITMALESVVGKRLQERNPEAFSALLASVKGRLEQLPEQARVAFTQSLQDNAPPILAGQIIADSIEQTPEAKKEFDRHQNERIAKTKIEEEKKPLTIADLRKGKFNVSSSAFIAVLKKVFGGSVSSMYNRYKCRIARRKGKLYQRYCELSGGQAEGGGGADDNPDAGEKKPNAESASTKEARSDVLKLPVSAKTRSHSCEIDHGNRRDSNGGEPEQVRKVSSRYDSTTSTNTGEASRNNYATLTRMSQKTMHTLPKAPTPTTLVGPAMSSAKNITTPMANSHHEASLAATTSTGTKTPTAFVKHAPSLPRMTV
ncbi:MAG: hypothetical protein EB059_02695 [Alphaproteobacteria bacterium]|nr:hypothetical protein [Alphaproteobacteria bacterium]